METYPCSNFTGIKLDAAGMYRMLTGPSIAWAGACGSSLPYCSLAWIAQPDVANAVVLEEVYSAFIDRNWACGEHLLVPVAWCTA